MLSWFWVVLGDGFRRYSEQLLGAFTCLFVEVFYKAIVFERCANCMLTRDLMHYHALVLPILTVPLHARICILLTQVLHHVNMSI